MLVNRKNFDDMAGFSLFEVGLHDGEQLQEWIEQYGSLTVNITLGGAIAFTQLPKTPKIEETSLHLRPQHLERSEKRLVHGSMAGCIYLGLWNLLSIELCKTDNIYSSKWPSIISSHHMFVTGWNW